MSIPLAASSQDSRVLRLFTHFLTRLGFTPVLDIDIVAQKLLETACTLDRADRTLVPLVSVVIPLWIRFHILFFGSFISLWFLDGTGSVCYPALSLSVLRFLSPGQLCNRLLVTKT
jgi:hypothetical protein